MITLEIFNYAGSNSPANVQPFDSIAEARDAMHDLDEFEFPADVYDGTRFICRNYPNRYDPAEREAYLLYAQKDPDWRRAL